MHADISIKRLLSRPETLEAEVAALRRENQQLRQENQLLRRDNQQLCQANEQLRGSNGSRHLPLQRHLMHLRGGSPDPPRDGAALARSKTRFARRVGRPAAPSGAVVLHYLREVQWFASRATAEGAKRLTGWGCEA